MDGKRVPQAMRIDRFANTATPTRLLARILYGVSADMIADLIAREKPSLGSIHSPPVAQDLQQLWRKHDIAVDAAFALFDSDNHSFAIDIGDFQADSLRDVQPSRVADGQNRAMLDIPHTAQKLQNFFRTRDDRQLLGLLGGRNDFLQAATARIIELGAASFHCLGTPGRNEYAQGRVLPVTY